MPKKECIILENAVERQKDIEGSGVHSEIGICVVTLLVMGSCSMLPGATRARTDFRDGSAPFNCVLQDYTRVSRIS